MSDPHQLQRFVAAKRPTTGCGPFFSHAQGPGPQRARAAFRLRIQDEAQACWQHPVLAARLRECIESVLAIEGKTALDIFGTPDCLKFHSCLTLFAQAAPQEPLFGRELAKYFSGVPDPGTLELL